MKKLLIAVVILAVLVGGYMWVRTFAVMDLSMLKGKTVRVHRGDLEVPITASGRIEPRSVTKIKSEASGEVVEIPYQIGDRAERDSLILRLDETDEQRSVDRALADFNRGEIAVQRADIALAEASEVGVPAAQAELEQAEARRDLAQLDYDKAESLQKRTESNPALASSPREFKEAQARLKEAVALVKGANAKFDQAKKAIAYAESDLATMKESREVARKTLEDARERLRETKVRAPITGLVLQQQVSLGEVIQSGKTSLTGGTVLMELADVSDLYAVVNVDEADIGLVHELAPEGARPGHGTSQPAEAPASRPVTDPGPAADGPAEPEPASQPKRDLPQGAIDTAQPVEITVESFPEEAFQGVIERIAPQSEVSQAIATFKVWIRVTSPNKEKLGGLLNAQTEAHFTAKSVTNTLLVAYDAFQKSPDGEGFGVFVPVPNPAPGEKPYVFKPCKFGVDNGIDVQVIEGLSEGEEVYTVLPVQTRKQEKEAQQHEDEE